MSTPIYLRKFLGEYEPRSMGEMRQAHRAKYGAPAPKQVRITYPREQQQNFRTDKTARALGKVQHA